MWEIRQKVDHWSNSPNWEEISMSEAQTLANQGGIVVAGAKAGPGEDHGHVVMIVPGQEAYSGEWKCNVPMTMDTGRKQLWASDKLSRGFGKDKKERTKFCRYKGPIQK